MNLFDNTKTTVNHRWRFLQLPNIYITFENITILLWTKCQGPLLLIWWAVGLLAIWCLRLPRFESCIQQMKTTRPLDLKIACLCQSLKIDNKIIYVTFEDITLLLWTKYQGPPLLPWINFHHSMGKWLHPLYYVGCNYLSNPKRQRYNCGSLGMDKQFHPTLYCACDYLSMVGLRLIHISKRISSGPLY